MDASVLKIRRALLSVSDKTGLVDLATHLAAEGVELVSTGGTAATLRDAGLAVREVTELTGFPEMLDGRVKTLHPAVHGGLLFVRGNPEQEAACLDQQIVPIDLLVVNLYPFESQLRSGVTGSDLIEQIDIGGPAMIRSAAKNHAHVSVVVDPEDYGVLLAEICQYGGVTQETRQILAGRAFSRTAAYDIAIANWFARSSTQSELPARLLVSAERVQTLRYGENSHQRAAFYRSSEPAPSLARATLVQGKPLSYNNLLDADAAWELVSGFSCEEGAAVAIVKHNTPCGVARAPKGSTAFLQARACDPVSSFGGIVACNQSLDAEVARLILEVFTEVVIAPDADAQAQKILAEKPNLRLLLTGEMLPPQAHSLVLRSVSGGFLLQDRDSRVCDSQSLSVRSKRQPTQQEWKDLQFAFAVARFVKSNAIVHVQGETTIGIGGGQTSRIDSARIANEKARWFAAQAQLELPVQFVTASDAFFPFPDALESVIDAGATAVIAPGGAMRDADVIAAADAAEIALVFTDFRCFRH